MRPRAIAIVAVLTAFAACGNSGAPDRPPRKRDEPATDPKDIPIPPSTPLTITPLCQPVRISLLADMVVIGRGQTRSIPHIGGTPDTAGLGAWLAEFAKVCVGPVHIEVTDDAAYQSLITVMDIAMKAGFQDIGLGDDSPAGGHDPSEPSDPLPIGSGSGSAALRRVPIIGITKTEVTVNGRRIGAPTDNLLEPIAAALRDLALQRPDPRPTAILQADTATPARTINEAVAAAKQAGFTNLLFAVKNR
jgi:biopolymer transport protein ExbD